MPLTSNGRNLVSEYVAKLGQNIVNYLWTSTYGLRPWLLNKTLKSKCHLVDHLKKSGINIIHDDGDSIKFADELNKKIPSDFIDSQIREMKESESINGFVKDVAPDLSKETKLQIIRYAVDQKRLGTVSSYLGFVQ